MHMFSVAVKGECGAGRVNGGWGGGCSMNAHLCPAAEWCAMSAQLAHRSIALSGLPSVSAPKVLTLCFRHRRYVELSSLRFNYRVIILLIEWKMVNPFIQPSRNVAFDNWIFTKRNVFANVNVQ